MRLNSLAWIALAACSGIGLVLGVLWVTSAQARQASAPKGEAPGETVRYVSRQGIDLINDCTSTSQPCKTIPNGIHMALKGGYHLQAESPAINLGDPFVSPLYDLDGTLRPSQQDVDTGAYEFIYPRLILPMILKPQP